MKSVQLLAGAFLLVSVLEPAWAAKVRPKSLQEAYAMVQGPTQPTLVEARQAWSIVCADWRTSI